MSNTILSSDYGPIEWRVLNKETKQVVMEGRFNPEDTLELEISREVIYTISSDPELSKEKKHGI